MARRIEALVAAGAFLGLGGACAQQVGAGPQAVDVMNRSAAAAFIMSKSASPSTGDYGVGSVLNELHGPVGRAVKRVTASEVTGSAASRRTAMLSGAAPERSRASAGAKVFQDLRCNNCHRPGAKGLGPPLEGLFGKTVRLQSGETMTADEVYVRESIVNPSAKVVSGFPPIMPTFQDLVTEERLLELIEYVKSLKAPRQVPTK